MNYKINKVICGIAFWILAIVNNACQSPTQQNEQTAQTSPSLPALGEAMGKSETGENLYAKDYETTSSGKKIRRSAMGVTIRFPNGWSKEDMDFQISYCQQSMASVKEIDGLKFCTCFLDKVQYYYEPIYVRDSYEHQKHWNQECFLAAQQ